MGIGIDGVNTLMWALEADTVEYGEWQTGNRTEGTTYAVFSFTRKMGQALGGFVGGLALTWAGFSAAARVQGQDQAAGVAENIQLRAGGPDRGVLPGVHHGDGLLPAHRGEVPRDPGRHRRPTRRVRESVRTLP